MTTGSFSISSHSAPWYLIGCAAVLPDLLIKCNIMTTFNMWLFTLKIPVLIPFSLVVYAASSYLSHQREVAIRAAFLGVITGLGIQIFFAASSSYRGLGMYIAFLAWFHFSEYYFTEKYNPKNAKLSSFMLNHSTGYNIALACSIIEFLVERYFFTGLAFSVIGEVIRKQAMYVAGANFNHIVQHDLQEEEHTLVTENIYAYMQHPSYTGWFVFTIGTQITLCNPVCLVCFPIVMWRFFEERVKGEEPPLERKHGEKYRKYKKNTPRFIPYVW